MPTPPLDDAPVEAPTPPTPAPDDAPPAPAPPPPPEPEPEAEPEPGPDAGAPPRVDARYRHDHSKPATSYIFEVPEGAGPVVVDAGFQPPAGGVCSGGTARIRLVHPAGRDVIDLAAFAVASGAACGERAFETMTLDPGAWTVRFDGSGAVVGVVAVTTA